MTHEQALRNIVQSLTLAVVFVIMGFFAVTAEGASNYEDIITKAAKRHKIDPLLIKAVIWRESKFNPKALGGAGEIGLMQIKVCAAEDWAVYNGTSLPSRREMFKPELNIEIGTWYLANARNTWQNYKFCYILALCQYNAGRRTMTPWVPSKSNDKVWIRNPKTKSYVIAVLNKYIEYSATASEVVKN